MIAVSISRCFRAALRAGKPYTRMFSIVSHKNQRDLIQPRRPWLPSSKTSTCPDHNTAGPTRIINPHKSCILKKKKS
ncbi:hypothetical protein L6452_34020 [Arctium lappa]|uniref:Uncharacterized protein n=1 Tax=Arctium lappa TaxID=4217 RepID=A0ACB8YGB6_ARCLA|nr:hypothetical protein L6452_34020 [Arctium lappa]